MAATTKAIVESLPGSGAPQPPAIQPQLDSSAVQPGSTPRPDTTLIAATPGAPVPVTPLAGSEAAPAGAPGSGPSAAVATPAPAALAPAPAAPVPPAAANGRTELDAGMFAVRSGDTVRVYFDTPEARTRRPEKFEQIVRATLPAVHGSAAASILGDVAPGALVGAADLLVDLPTRGVHLRSTDGRALSLWPETRAGRDGPLVVSYRSVLAR